MRHTSARRPRRSALDTITNLVAIGMVLIVGFLAWPLLVSTFQARFALAPAPAQAPQVRPQAPQEPFLAPIGAQSVSQPGIAQNEATSAAMYQATAAATLAQPAPNVRNVVDPAPVLRESKPSQIEPAAGVVPTAEPIVQTNDQFGSKQAPVNIQATHQCLHGQVWVDDSGCHNPTPVK